ncbi:MAG: hypothetical protein WB779_09295 [Ignavibacteriaceae bacterium]
MNERKVILGEFEDELNARVARRDLRKAGIKSQIFKENYRCFSRMSEDSDAVKLVVTDAEQEKAREILATRFM